MGRRDGDDDGDAADVDAARAVGDGDLAELVARLQLLGQFGHDLLGHARVALVLEVVDRPAARVRARRADEGGDPAGASSATCSTTASATIGSSVSTKAPPETGGIRATSSPSASARVLAGVLQVDRIEQALGLVAEAERGPDVGHAVDAVELALRPAGALAKPGEEAHADHAGEPSLTRRAISP